MTGFDLSTISDVYVGSTQYSSIYKGSTLIWTAQTQLPYDAELEYLEANGTQYIDTGILNDSSVIIDLVMSASGTNCLNGGEAGSAYRYKFGSNGNGYLYYGFGGYNHTAANTICTLTDKYTLHMEQGSQYAKDTNDNTLLSSTRTLSTFSSYNLTLFRCRSGNSFVSSNGSMRIYSCNIKKTGVSIEFIPVRIGTVGYMYDKVSGQLFGNAGTGNFTLGPDKTS